MYAIFAMREMMLTAQASDLQVQLMELSQKQTDLATFGASIQDGMITPEEAASMPSEYLNSAFAIQNNIMAQATPMAQVQWQMYANSMAAQAARGMQDPRMAPNNQLIYNSILRQTMEMQARGIQRKIAADEKKIEQERIKLETRLKKIQSEMDALKQAKDKGIEKSVPQYA